MQATFPFQERKEFLIAIDSDGCVFDTMEVKHKECFCPVTIRHYSLQAISKYAREAWEFVNLYSVHRGMNRFPALIKVMDLLNHRPEVRRRNAVIPKLYELREWINGNPKLGNPELSEATIEQPALTDVLQWSESVNESVSKMVQGVPPFPFVHEALSKASPLADMVVASSTPVDALEREWGEHGLSNYVQVIAGQEMGSKSHQLSAISANHYESDHVLMIGDAFSDYRAAKSIDACFFPILPGDEESSWQRFVNEALRRFFRKEYKGSYQEELIDELRQRLPENPHWVISESANVVTKSP